jgi:pimeloyl-ACP methyl ester carboxylesterase
MLADTTTVLRDLWFKVDGLRIHCLAAGTGGRPILLLHGGGLDAAGLSFRNAITVLARNRLVFAPDWPGFGRSAAMPSGWRVEECVAFLGAHNVEPNAGAKNSPRCGVSTIRDRHRGFA